MGKRGPTASPDSKSVTIQARATPAARDALALAAKANGRSVSAEVEYRLNASLSGGLPEVWDSPIEWAVIQVIARTIRMSEAYSGLPWEDDAFTFDLTVAAICQVLRELRPVGQAEMPDTFEPLRLAKAMFPGMAETMATALKAQSVPELASGVAYKVTTEIQNALDGRRLALDALGDLVDVIRPYFRRNSAVGTSS